MLVLFCRCVAPDHALDLVSVLSAYSLQASCVVVASGGPLRRRRAGSRSENSRRASGALAASRDVFVSLDKFQASRSESGHLAALVVVHNPRSAWRPRHGAVFLVATTLVRAGRALGSRTCANRLHSASEMDWFGILARRVPRWVRGSTGVKSRSEVWLLLGPSEMPTETSLRALCGVPESIQATGSRAASKNIDWT